MTWPYDDSPEGDWLHQHEALTTGTGVAGLVNRTLIGITGADRASFLHNFTTNDIRRLAPGAGCETFITNGQGKCVAYGHVFADDDRLIFETAPDQTDKIIAHLDHYLIREKVTLSDLSTERGALLVAGQGAEKVLTKLAGTLPPRERLSSANAQIGSTAVRMRRFDIIGPDGWLLECVSADLTTLVDPLVDGGVRRCSAQAFDAARIEAGSPIYGVDITDKNLPQEVARDDRAISFTKGCYLGQETVARIDALGRVNRTLVGVKFDSTEPPEVGAALSVGADGVGEVTSSTYSPRLKTALALAYVRRGSNAVGTRLESRFGCAEVIALPVSG